MPTDRLIKVRLNSLIDFCNKLFIAVSVPPDEAQIITTSLIEADRRGVRSHGVVCIPRYISLIQKGKMRNKCEYKVLQEYGAVSVWDGMRSNGQVLGYKAMKEAICKARKYGISFVAVKGSNHFGAGAYYSQLAEKEGMIGIVSSTGSPTMAPWGGAERMIGNNPLAVSIPAGSRKSIDLDMAQSVVAFGKITNLAKQGETTIPPGWAFDSDGVETVDVSNVHSVIPIGGHKGFGLSLVIDIISGILFGGATGDRAGDENEGPSHSFMAIDIDVFGNRDRFINAVETRIAELKGCRLAKDSDGIFMPGEIEHNNYEKSQESVELITEVVNDLNILACELGIEKLTE